MKWLRFVALYALAGLGGQACTVAVGGSEESLAEETAGLDPVAPATTPQTGDRYGREIATGDFDGDGRADIAIGVPGQSVSAHSNAGAVIVEYGARGPASRQVLTQDRPGMPDTAENDELFGEALAAGDFNGDGKDDLAIGVPGEMVEGVANAGAVHVIFGSASGLTAASYQVIDQGGPGGLFDMPDEGDLFGWNLVSGDFNGDLVADLVIAVDDNMVQVIPGSPDGLLPARANRAAPPAAFRGFGKGLAVGDLNGDLKDDLVVGSPLTDVGGHSQAGSIHVFYGTFAPLSIIVSSGQQYSQDSAGIAGTAEAMDRFGWSVACGDFNWDGFDDVAVGVAEEDVGSVVNAGSVNIIFGSANGPKTDGNYQLHLDSTGVTGSPVANGAFGTSLTAGKFDWDHRADLAVGMPELSVGGGSVYVFLGTSEGPNGSTDTVFTQDTPGVAGASESNDLFGHSLTSGDFNRDGRSDLVVGIPGEDIGSALDAGAVQLLLGSGTGITATGNLLFTEE